MTANPHMTSERSFPQDMEDALDAFCVEAQTIIDTFLKTLEAQPIPPVIYHYTDDVGLRGILKTGQLWLTDIFNLNDPSEMKYGFSHALRILNSKAANGPPESKIFAKQLEDFALSERIERTGFYFICSFSSCGNDLCQWRAYADNGRGYALGFDTKALRSVFTQERGSRIPNYPFHLTYDKAHLGEIQLMIIEKVFGLISLPRGRKLESAARDAYMHWLSTWFMVYALRAALCFKHKAYQNEKEYRFLQIHPATTPPKFELRARPHELVKYREFDWRSGASGALKKIVVGPAADHEKAHRFAKECLRLWQGDAETVEITHSKIPYRAV